MDPYASLPTLTADGDSVRVGPEGGRATLDRFTIEVPRGALSESTILQVRPAERSPFSPTYGSALGPILELSPAGLVFEIPIKLTLVLDAAPPAAQPGNDGFFVVSTDLEGTGVEDVALLREESEGTSVKTWIWHFSHVGAFPMPDRGQTVQDIAAAGCTTAPVAGLTEEIRRIIEEQALIELAPIDFGNGLIAGRELSRPAWIAPSAGTSLSAARAMRPPGTALLTINSAWRSVAQQYVLGRCRNLNATAQVGGSFHLIGAAIDAQSRGYLSRDCPSEEAQTRPDQAALRDRLHPTWGALLEANRAFAWFGSETTSTCERPRAMRSACPCDDPPHFEHLRARATDHRPRAMLAFQMLWARRYPCAAIPAEEMAQTQDTALTRTLEYLSRSPAAGFGDIDAIELPAMGAGCTEGMSCCPADAMNATPYCAMSCTGADAGVDAGLDASTDAEPSDGGAEDAADLDAGSADVDLDAGQLSDAGTTTVAYTLSPDPALQYPDRGSELSDGVIASGTDWVDSVGWFNTSPEIVIDFGGSRAVSTYELYVGNSFGNGEFAVYRPAAAEISVSTDGLSFSTLGTMSWSVHSEAGTKYQVDLGSLAGAATARYVKFAITYGPDVRGLGGSWLQVSEVRAY